MRTFLQSEVEIKFALSFYMKSYKFLIESLWIENFKIFIFNFLELQKNLKHFIRKASNKKKFIIMTQLKFLANFTSLKLYTSWNKKNIQKGNFYVSVQFFLLFFLQSESCNCNKNVIKTVLLNFIDYTMSERENKRKVKLTRNILYIFRIIKIHTSSNEREGNRVRQTI